MVIPTFTNNETKRDKKGAYITVYFKQDLDITEDMIPYVNYQIIFKNTPKYDYCGFHWFKTFPTGVWTNYWERYVDGDLINNAISNDFPYWWGSHWGIPSGESISYVTSGDPPNYPNLEYRKNIPNASYSDSTTTEFAGGGEMNTFVKKGDNKYVLYVAKKFYIYGIDTELKPNITSPTDWERIEWEYTVTFDGRVWIPLPPPPEGNGRWAYYWTISADCTITRGSFYNNVWYPKNIETNFKLLINTNKK